MVSPLLWAKIARGLSAGRVQSVAVRLIVEREREIRKFVPEEFWQLHADLTAGGTRDPVRFEVTRYNDKPYRPVNDVQSKEHVDRLKAGSFKVVKREDKPTRRNGPLLPLLPRHCSRRPVTAWGSVSRKP